MAEYWNENVTQKSWEKLQEIAKQFDFAVIGGWAVYLWTKQHKSKDIDIVITLPMLHELKTRFELAKNDRLKKYEIKFNEFDTDIYVPHFSQLELPIEELLQNTIIIEGIKTIPAEHLLILKQGAEINRRNSVKGRKDAIDIVSLLIYAVDLNQYGKILKKHGKMHLAKQLEHVLASFDNKDCAYVGKNFKEFTDWKKKILEEIKKLK
ncbi:MAG: hypothetical protein Q8R15_02270 [Candidatus Micrarchaeota archaeon]|nr:hypothetical protein [Candidatus Micrarchaeota archaeon]